MCNTQLPTNLKLAVVIMSNSVHWNWSLWFYTIFKNFYIFWYQEKLGKVRVSSIVMPSGVLLPRQHMAFQVQCIAKYSIENGYANIVCIGVMCQNWSLPYLHLHWRELTPISKLRMTMLAIKAISHWSCSKVGFNLYVVYSWMWHMFLLLFKKLWS